MKKEYKKLLEEINKLNRSIRRIRVTLGDEYGIRGSEAQLLLCLSANPRGLSNSKIIELCDMDKAAVSRVVSKMVEGGYIELGTKNGSSRYKARAILTKEGSRIVKAIEGKYASILKKTFSILENKGDDLALNIDVVNEFIYIFKLQTDKVIAKLL